jgi:hypothetical protein
VFLLPLQWRTSDQAYRAHAAGRSKAQQEGFAPLMRPMQHEYSNLNQLLQPVWAIEIPELCFVCKDAFILLDVSQAVPPVLILHRALPQGTTVADMHFGAVRFHLLYARFLSPQPGLQAILAPCLASMPKVKGLAIYSQGSGRCETAREHASSPSASGGNQHLASLAQPLASCARRCGKVITRSHGMCCSEQAQWLRKGRFTCKRYHGQVRCRRRQSWEMNQQFIKKHATDSVTG